jgi:hypothetical protein
MGVEEEAFLAGQIIKLSESIYSVNLAMVGLENNLVETQKALSAIVAYLDKVRDIIHLPPMFPADPDSGDYFYDEKTNTQYVYYVDAWDDDAGEGQWEEID